VRYGTEDARVSDSFFEPDDEGEPPVRARAWRLRTEKVDFEASSGFRPAPPGPEAAEPGSFPDMFSVHPPDSWIEVFEYVVGQGMSCWAAFGDAS